MATLALIWTLLVGVVPLSLDGILYSFALRVGTLAKEALLTEDPSKAVALGPGHAYRDMKHADNTFDMAAGVDLFSRGIDKVLLKQQRGDETRETREHDDERKAKKKKEKKEKKKEKKEKMERRKRDRVSESVDVSATKRIRE